MAETALSSLIRLKIGCTEYVAKCWGDSTKPPLLALHGWLDNCASFDLLAVALTNYYVVCVDSAGHGQSSHFPELHSYSLWREVGDVFRIADQLNWQAFHLIGHSRGAMMAFLAAGTLPERIISLTLLEGVYPTLTEPAAAPKRLREAILDLNIQERRPRRYYASFEQAVDARVNGRFPVCYQDALLLARHGVADNERGYYWRYDAKLLAKSEVGFSAEQVEAFQAAISAKTTVFIAEDGYLVKDAHALSWLHNHPGFNCIYLPGGHHFHMHSQASAIAEHINLAQIKQ